MNELDKGYTKKKFRRKIPKVSRGYKRHQNEDKTFDKSKDINDLIEQIINEENIMNKSIEQEIDEMGGWVEKSTTDVKQELIKTIKELGAEGLKEAIADSDVNDDQRELLKSVLVDMKKAISMDDAYEAKKVVSTVESSRIEQETRSDDEDEKLVKPEAATHNHQGDITPEGRENHVIKSVDKLLDKAYGKSCDAEQVLSKKKKSIKDLKTLKGEVIKSYEDAGLGYNDELIKAEMKKRILKEESQVEMGGQDKGGKPDRKKKESAPDIEEGKNADETADGAIAKVGKMAKSIPTGDPQASMRALSRGRNFHYSVNGYYDEVLAKAAGKGKEEVLEKSEEKTVYNINDVIEKGLDSTMCDVATEDMQKSQIMGNFAKPSFEDEHLLEGLGLTKKEAEKILGK